MDIRAKATGYDTHLQATQGAFALDAVLKEVANQSTASQDPFIEQVRKDKPILCSANGR